VFRATKNGLAPPVAELAKLPNFVRESRVPTQQLLGKIGGPGVESYKPVLFFYSPTPRSLLVRVHFQRGRPWAYYPSATRYLPTFRHHPAFLRSIGSLNGLPSPVRMPEFHDSTEGVPIWWKGHGESRTLATAELQGDQQPLFSHVPWLRPSTHLIDHGHGRRSSPELISVGLEWRGLRVGYDEKLEPPLPPIDAASDSSSWWKELRAVPSSIVATRGESERCLFYDGSTSCPTPVAAWWTNESRAALSLAVRSYGEYPAANWRRNEPSPDRQPTQPVPAVFVIDRRDKQPPRGRVLRSLSPKDDAHTVSLEELPLEGEALIAVFHAELCAAGLTKPEATALVEIWRPEFFETAGTRVLSILPRWIYDLALPIEILPTPGELERVGVAWAEGSDLPFAPPIDLGPKTIDAKSILLAPRREDALLPTSPLELTAPRQISLDEDGRLLGLTSPVSTVTLSGNGRFLAVTTEATTPDAPGLWRVDLESGDAVRIDNIRLAKARRASHVSICDDGNRIAFSIATRSTSTILLADFRAKSLTVVSVDAWLPTVSPDGRWVAFSSRPFVLLHDLERGETIHWDVQLNGPVAISLTSTPPRLAITCPSEFSSPACLLLLDPGANSVRNLSAEIGSDGEPQIAPDGSFVVFRSSRERDDEILVADLVAQTFTNVSRHSADERLPTSDAKGRYVAFVRESSIVVVDREKGVTQTLADHADVRSLSLSADGTKICFTSKNDDVRQVYVRTLDR
jgi:hypothetical protein